ncbi:hypothetical protein KI809_10160 [Geobacter pelophilus]|uniref:Uncharacterized protein n=1 Tax=Geoanaerobacter pelophilus TaxID=60036 RepID=A0AAW4L529_9BACT|nr:hypothetical protein [Geoanaerobacter pelophilus]MBT0664662.1 hypothetical protein [Geoanaerobacter pelophilus]
MIMLLGGRLLTCYSLRCIRAAFLGFVPVSALALLYICTQQRERSVMTAEPAASA